MKSDGIFKQVSAVFIVALAIYIVAYHAIEDRRTHHGPWEVRFTQDATGAPALLINEPKLAITNVMIVFPGEIIASTNQPTTLALVQPRATPFDVPFGKCVFMDATSLPGTLVFELFDHEIQLLPRALTIDKIERPWVSPMRVVLDTRPVSPPH